MKFIQMQVNSTSKMPLIYHTGPENDFLVQTQQKKHQNNMRNTFTVTKTPERRPANFEYTSKLVLKFLLMNLNR